DALAILADPAHSDETLSTGVISLLSEAMMLTSGGAARENDIVAALNKALADPREHVRLAALWSLVGTNHAGTAVALLSQSLKSPDGALYRPADAIHGLALAHQAVISAALIRPYLAHPEPALRAAAANALGGDRESWPTLRQLLGDRTQPV